MKTQKSKLFAVGLVSGLVASALTGQAFAQESGIPLTFTVSETVTRDSNLTRTTQPNSDITSQTDMRLRLDKFYGRQNYTASGRFGIARYKNNEQFNNTNYDLDARFATEIASNWSVSLSGSAAQNLNSGANGPANARLDKNVLKARDVDLSVRYGVAGRWSLVGSLGNSHQSYSSTLQRYQNRDQTSQGLRLVYSPSDLLNFSVGGSRAQSEYPNLKPRNSTEPEQVTQNSLDLGTNWQVTGFSSLDALVRLSKNSYKSDSKADYSAVTSRINWGFRPRGALAYNLAFARTTDSDASQTANRTGNIAATQAFNDPNQIFPLAVDTSFSTITTSLNGNVRWTPTAKLGFTLGLARYNYDVKKEVASSYGFNLVGNPSESDSSNLTQFSMGGDYRYSRLLAFGCNVQKYKQTVDITRIAYDGHAYGCTASLTLD
ncbi:MAG: hypothetical protein EOP36_11110 [Rubrivivax sp.]|nr:MAG: hypothetical protein EOP36_11110 [Rubrivivax sp.]